MKYRIESDFLGEMKIPSDAYYGTPPRISIALFEITSLEFIPCEQ